MIFLLIMKKIKRYSSKRYLDFIRKFPCCMTGRTPVDAHHIRDASNSGTGIKPHDTYAIPLHYEAHIYGVHQKGKEKFWGKNNQYLLCTKYISKYFTEELRKDYKKILLQLLISYIYDEIKRDGFTVLLSKFHESLKNNRSISNVMYKRKAISVLYNYFDKDKNIDPYRLTIELSTEYLANLGQK